MLGKRTTFLVVALVFSARAIFADGLVYRYEGEVLPTDPAAGWSDADPCINECTQSVQDGLFILSWDGGVQRINYVHNIVEAPTPPPETLWVEWSFLSNHPFKCASLISDGTFIVDYKDVASIIHMFGDAAMSFGAIEFRGGLEIDEFHTYRFESTDGVNHCVYVDGEILFCDQANTPGNDTHGIQISGEGGCDLDLQPTFNKYDFIRYGTISSGELIVSTDPPIGELDRTKYPDFDRFTVTFDSPNYVTIDQITVELAGGGDPPVVIKTRRLLNGDPETVEIVLDRPLVIGQTTTFTLNDGTATNVVEYTLVEPIPTTSTWTFLAMTLLVLTAGTLVLRGRADPATRAGQ